MARNPYFPKGLPLIPDHILRAIFATYREVSRTFVQLELRGVGRADAHERLVYLRDASREIERELHARGIGGPPWWAAPHRRDVQAPSVRVADPGSTPPARSWRPPGLDVQMQLTSLLAGMSARADG